MIGLQQGDVKTVMNFHGRRQFQFICLISYSFEDLERANESWQELECELRLFDAQIFGADSAEEDLLSNLLLHRAHFVVSISLMSTLCC